MEDQTMARLLVTDALWEEIEPYLPASRSYPKGGRPRITDRAALTGILFVLKSGIAWEDLPQEMGCGCGMSCWRRLRDWQKMGVWHTLHCIMLDRLNGAGQLDWSRAVADSTNVRAVFGGTKPARIPRIGASPARNTMS